MEKHRSQKSLSRKYISIKIIISDQVQKDTMEGKVHIRKWGNYQYILEKKKNSESITEHLLQHVWIIIHCATEPPTYE
jgi:hypothetical protein